MQKASVFNRPPAAEGWPLFWHSPEGSLRNEFCIFERFVEIESIPEICWVEIFADTRYRLFINGHIVACGPPRFLPHRPHCEHYELRDFLRPGTNLLRVEVNSRGAPSYQAIRSKGGLALRGTIGEVELALPRDWVVKTTCGWDPKAEPFSFAQGPIEIRDLRAAEFNQGRPIARLDRAHWGTILPSPISPACLRPLKSPRIVRSGLLEKGRFRKGFRGPEECGGRLPFCFHLFSPIEQTLTATMSWGPVSLNGRWLTTQSTPELVNQETVGLKLLPGLNFCFGIPELLKPRWTWQMEFPENFGLVVSALPGAAEPFLVGAPTLSAARVEGLLKHPPATAGEIPFDISQWNLAGLERPPSPAKELSWDRISEDLIAQGSGLTIPAELPGNADSTLVLDFESEYLGYPFVEIDAPSGTVVDLGYDEKLSSTGIPEYFLSNPFVNAADRFVLREGYQRVDGFHPRGGRYLQITIRGATRPVRILGVGILSAVGTYPHVGNFVSGDQQIDWAWKASERTLFASMADGWIDPWREQGLYLGDALVQGHATRKITPDWRLDPWSLRLWSDAQFGNGQLPDVVPSPHDTPLIDYTLIWIVALRNYWAESGDLPVVRELWPTVSRILTSPAWVLTLDGLWEVGENQTAFIDWGATLEERTGVNACLNALRYRALTSALELARAIGFHHSATQLEEEAAALKEAFHKHFWDEKEGRFFACLQGDRPWVGPSLHATALALAFGLEKNDARTGEYLARHLKVNGDFPEGRIEIYFLYFALIALRNAGRIADAENAIRNYYGFMQTRGAWTLWESLQRGAEGKDSMCHGWSSGVIPYLAECTLGIQYLVPGDPTHILIAPESETLNSVSGQVAHPYGLIAVAWEIRDAGLHITVSHPDTVRITVKPAGRLATFPKTVSRRAIRGH